MIALDTNVFIYVLNAHEQFGPVSANAIKSTEPKLASELVFAEILASQKLRNPKAREKAQLFLDEVDVAWRPITKAVLLEAARIRRENPACKIADAIHVATAIVGLANRLITNDNDLAKLKDLPLKIVLLT